MSHNRLNKYKNTVQRMKLKPLESIEHTELDKSVFDIVLKKLFENSAKNTLHLENEIYAPAHLKLKTEDAERIWEIMISTGWVSPVIGFGNGGKVELTRAGYQLMAQYGGYSQYLASVNQPAQPQTIILPIQVQEDPEPEKPQISCDDTKPAPARKKPGKRHK